MKTHFWRIALFLVIVLLAACQPANPTAQPTQPVDSSGTTGESAAETEAYPGPDQTQPENTSALSGQSLYPDPKSGDEVSWAQAVMLIQHDEVSKVFIAKSLQVTLTLKDGRSLVTMEPSPGSMKAALDQCGEICQGVSIESE